MPIVSTGIKKPRAFLYGMLSGIVEPIGAMIYVVVEELIPEAQAGEHSDIGTIGVAVGFSLMMLLDVALG